MLKTIELKDAVGSKLAHDITEIRPGEFKGPAFREKVTLCVRLISAIFKSWEKTTFTSLI